MLSLLSMGAIMASHNSAKAFSKLGASKGGKARANVLSSTERTDIARHAALRRWGREPDVSIENAEGQITVIDAKATDIPELPYSMFPGTLQLGNISLECHVLSNYKRVFTQREIVRVISGGRDSGNLQRYLSRNPLIDAGFLSGLNMEFTIPGLSSAAKGYEATALIEICDKYLEAKSQNLLRKSQYGLAKQAEIIVRATAKVGIIALIDEVTGFQKFRAQQELQLKIQAFIADELQEWARMFPQEFWLELARLEGIRYSARNRPLRWGRYIMMFVYDAIDSDIGNQLREKNPNPRFQQNHHQWLKEFGRQKVHDQIERVVTNMKLCDNMDDFRQKFDRVFKRAPQQIAFTWEGAG